MNIKKSVAFAVVAAVAVLTYSCKITYSFSGASIPDEARTISVAYISNNAAMVAPILSSTFREALQDKFTRQTRLELVSDGGDFAFEGEITNYNTAPSAVSGDEYAVYNRLTITVRIRFTNVYQPENSFERSFSAYSDYPTSSQLTEVETELITEIVDMLVDDIFNAAASNW